MSEAQRDGSGVAIAGALALLLVLILAGGGFFVWQSSRASVAREHAVRAEQEALAAKLTATIASRVASGSDASNADVAMVLEQASKRLEHAQLTAETEAS